MKKIGLVIENDFEIAPSVQGFLKDNPNLFEKIFEVVYAMHRKDLIGEGIKKGANTILTSSTFMHKDQLEENVLLFDSIPTDFTFYAEGVTRQLNRFVASVIDGDDVYVRDRCLFDDYEKFIQIIIKWVEQGLVYTIIEDYTSSVKIKDNFHNQYGSAHIAKERSPWISDLVVYSKKYNMFYEQRDEEESCADEIKFVHETR